MVSQSGRWGSGRWGRIYGGIVPVSWIITQDCLPNIEVSFGCNFWFWHLCVKYFFPISFSIAKLGFLVCHSFNNSIFLSPRLPPFRCLDWRRIRSPYELLSDLQITPKQNLKMEKKFCNFDRIVIFDFILVKNILILNKNKKLIEDYKFCQIFALLWNFRKSFGNHICNCKPSWWG